MSTNGTRDNSRRGSALVMVVIFAGLLAGMVVFMHTNTLDSAAMSSLRENRDTVIAAADLATEMAVANLSTMELESPNSDPLAEPPPEGSPDERIVIKDWVRLGPYHASNSDQRRIGGTFVSNGENMEYRVLVRSLRDAREYETMPDSWLHGVADDAGEDDSDSFVFEDPSRGKLRKYTGTYEITASARKAGTASASQGGGVPPGNNSGTTNPRLAVSAATRTLVTLSYQHPLNTQEDQAVFNSDNLALLNPTSALHISGEDHYGLKAVVQNLNQEIRIEDITSIKGTDSQLFSVTNISWSAAEQTLQYQMDPAGLVYNPHIPRTPTFGSSVIDKSMISLNENTSYQDKYVFGGKRENGVSVALDNGPYSAQTNYAYGRSVTFADDDRDQSIILENSPTEGRPTAQSQVAFAIGKFENFNRLYLNYTLPRAQRLSATNPGVPTHPADNATAAAVQTWKGKWDQLPLTYWSKVARKAGQYNNQVPLDNSSSPERRHMATRFWIKNKAGEFLVRDYTYAGNSATPTEDWDGYYIWSRYYGYRYSINSSTGQPTDVGGSGKYHLGFPYGNTERTIHTRLLSLEELTGFEVTKGSDGLPAKLQDNDPNKIMPGSPAFVIDPETNKMIPYRINESGFESETQFNERAQRENTPDNYGIKTSNVDDSRYPPRDGIYVVERDSSGNRVMVTDPETGKLTPKVTVYRTMEDFAYELNLAPPGEEEDLRKMVTIHMVVEDTPETHPSGNNMYFDMGVCISVVYPKIIQEEIKVNIFEGMDKWWWEGLAQETLTDRKSHNAVTGRSPKEVLEAKTPEKKLEALYNYAFGGYTEDDTKNIFTMVGDDGNLRMFKKAVLDTAEHSPEVGTLLNKDDEEPGAFYYASRDDIYRVLAGLLTQGRISNALLSETPDLVAYGMEFVRHLPANAGAQFRPVGERFATDTGYREAFLQKEPPSALTVSDNYTSSRMFAAEVFGKLPQRLQARYTVRENGNLREADYADLGNSSASGRPAPTTVKLPFLPSERLLRGNENGIYSGSSSNFVPIMNTQHNTVQYDGRPLEPRILSFEELKAELRRFPPWLDQDAIKLGYGQRESTSRGGIGWHRSGPRYNEPLMQDHYEYIIAGEPGFMPYVLAPTGDIALIRDHSPAMPNGDVRSEFLPMLKDPKEMPTFTIAADPMHPENMPTLDGAGILVINGNLLISTEFAYHGTLVVMGDLIMKPEDMLLPKRNEYGLIINAEGKALLNDKDGYYYNGLYGERIPSEPEMEMRHASQLILQGQLYLGGSVVQQPVEGILGTIDIRGSSGAIEDVTGSMFDGQEQRSLSRLLHTDVENQAEIDELWNPAQ